MSRVPSTQKKPARFRGQTSSGDYNTLQEDSYYDIVELYNMTNQFAQDLEAASGLLTTTSRFQQIRIQSLEQEVKKLQDELSAQKNQIGSHIAYAFIDNMTGSLSAVTGEQAIVDQDHGVVHLPIAGKAISKMHIIDSISGAVVVPSSLKVYTLPETGFTGSQRIEENDPIFAADGQPTTYWHRQVMVPVEYPPKAPVTCEVYLQLPDTIISNQDVNMISLRPFPMSSMTLNKIEYSFNGDYKLLPGWPLDGQGKPIPYEHIGNLKFCIPSTAISTLKITLTQPNSLTENQRLVYHFGLQDVDISYANFQSQVGKCDITVAVPAGTMSRKLVSLKPHFANTALLSDLSDTKAKLFSYHIYSLDTDNKTEYIKDRFPTLVSTDRILIKATIYYDSQAKVTPALEYIELTYQDV